MGVPYEHTALPPLPLQGAGCTNCSRWCRCMLCTLYTVQVHWWQCKVQQMYSVQCVNTVHCTGTPTVPCTVCAYCTVCAHVHCTDTYTVHPTVRTLYGLHCTGTESATVQCIDEHTVHCTISDLVQCTLCCLQVNTVYTVTGSLRRSQCATQPLVHWPFPGPCIVNTGCVLYTVHCTENTPCNVYIV